MLLKTQKPIQSLNLYRKMDSEPSDRMANHRHQPNLGFPKVHTRDSNENSHTIRYAAPRRDGELNAGVLQCDH